MASPLQIEINASNGASDYGNKFGEPIIQVFFLIHYVFNLYQGVYKIFWFIIT